MIVSASRRTDIPRFYADWFFNRLREGCALVRNPFRTHQVGRVPLTRDAVDGFVFWTKDPRPMLKKLDRLSGYPYYFQYTLNAYELNVEPSLAGLEERISAFRSLSSRIGPGRVIWRYDPILFGPGVGPDEHRRRFEALAEKLRGYTDRCTISFLDVYPKNAARLKESGLRAPDGEERRALAAYIAQAAAANGIRVSACCEDGSFSDCGIGRAKCVDSSIFEAMTGFSLRIPKDKSQREGCGCAASVDIGAYGTCPGGCRYCYATRSAQAAEKSFRGHDPKSPLLCSALGQDDAVSQRKAESLRSGQIRFEEPEGKKT